MNGAYPCGISSVPWHHDDALLWACRQFVKNTSQNSTSHCLSTHAPHGAYKTKTTRHVPFMSRSSKVKQFLNPTSKNTDQLGLCGVVHIVTPYFPTNEARLVRVIPEVVE